MHARVCSSPPRVIARAVTVAALVLAASLTFTVAASAQTGFQASISGVNPKPRPCPNGEFFCGTAITNYGPASWELTPVSVTPLDTTCASYEAAVTFELGDGSTLVLDERGTACEPGNAFSAPGGLKSYGNPFTVSGSWTVQSASGQFAPVNGAGTDALKAAGARVTGTYSQTS